MTDQRTKSDLPDVIEAGKTVTSRIFRRNDDLEAEAVDPYAMGYDAAANLEEPPPCPFKEGMAAKLWREGFSARVRLHIADKRRWGGLNVQLT